jgi:4-hydroxybenzoyl-CoA thioesterase
MTAFRFEREVGFDDVDAAQIVFFPRLIEYCHDALAAMLAPVAGGYVGLIRDRRFALAPVHAEIDVSAPLRFGDTIRVDVVVAKIGTSSCSIEFSLAHARSDTSVARIAITFAGLDLCDGRKAAIQGDVRRVLEGRMVSAVERG